VVSSAAFIREQAGNAAGTALGAKLGDATSAGGKVTITPTSN
jgi:hypothetical protein